MAEFKLNDGKIYYGHRLVARLEPGLNGMFQSEIADALEFGIAEEAYAEGWRDGYREAEDDAEVEETGAGQAPNPLQNEVSNAQGDGSRN